MNRDLSGFRAVPVPPPPAPSDDDPPRKATAPVVPATPAPRRRKVMTSLPAELHRQLRAAAEARQVYKTDVVLMAMAHHAATIGEERRRLQADGSHPPRRRRRRGVIDATQCQLYLTDAEQSEIDELAAGVAMSRSELVSLVLERELAQD